MLTNQENALRQVRKRDRSIVAFDPHRIERAITGAFLEYLDLTAPNELSDEFIKLIGAISHQVVEETTPKACREEGIDVEEIQDIVEKILMREGLYQVARLYILYREAHAKARSLSLSDHSLQINCRDSRGSLKPFSSNVLRKMLYQACCGVEESCNAEELVHDVCTQLFDGIPTAKIHVAAILSARARIEKEPDYDVVAARLLCFHIYNQIFDIKHPSPETIRTGFNEYVEKGIEYGQLDPILASFDRRELSQALQPNRDDHFTYLGLQTLYDRYLLHVNESRIETPQYFWMRVAMGLAKEEKEKEKWAIAFYEQLSTFRFLSGTPTLFHSGTCHPQLSSCYLTTIKDDLEHIFKSIKDNALLSKWAGGLGNDWTNIRATGARIKGTNGTSQGLIPFLKVVNDTAVAVNQGGKRKGAVCAYIEPWHYDFEDFLDLRKNTGDDRRRAHDLNTASWIPDLFMKRVIEDGNWYLFCPNEAQGLHESYGTKFDAMYQAYEKLAEDGVLQFARKLSARSLWKKMLSKLFETGHPWITWKDPSNIRSTQSHIGVIHSSNLCTEILLNTSEEETAVCNLGSINLPKHIQEGDINFEMLQETITVAIRMLDNVIDINFYPTKEAEASNRRHRPVGLGLMGFQDALVQLKLPYDSEKAVEFADTSMEAISYFAILASSDLALERGPYRTYEGSKWDQGLFPIDTIDLVEKERNVSLDISKEGTLDWNVVREAVRKNGMRNSNVLAIAPTATISHIAGVSQSIEPFYSNLFVKSNLSGEFTFVNRSLVADLKKIGLWSHELHEWLKHHDGSIQQIGSIPVEIKALYKTAFEIEPYWLIECAARRQKWIDMGQSLNLYINTPSGKLLDQMYQQAWRKGLKTTYYLRSKAATQIEKATLDVNKFGIQPKWMKSQSASSTVRVSREHCSLDSDCDACQ